MGRPCVVDKIASYLGPDFPLFHAAALKDQMKINFFDKFSLRVNLFNLLIRLNFQSVIILNFRLEFAGTKANIKNLFNDLF